MGFKIIKNQYIPDLTTWKIPYQVKYFIDIENKEDLKNLCITPEFQETTKKIILGKGSNTLFIDNIYNGMIICTKNMSGAFQYKETETHEYWEVRAGQNWSSLVDFFVYEANLGGLENLTLIPGTIGAAPVQNIGAYGCSFSDICEWVEIFDFNTQCFKKYPKEDCDFGYRSSIFKEKIILQQLFIITSVGIKLRKPNVQNMNFAVEANYESLKQELKNLGNAPYTIQQICEAVKNIRIAKLPDIDNYGTNGSTFVNPVVKGIKLKELLIQYPQLPYYPPHESKEIENHVHYRIAAGHILEKLGWRYKNTNNEWFVKQINDIGVWKNHALIVVNYGTTNPIHIMQMIDIIKKSFFDATKITLNTEINIIE